MTRATTRTALAPLALVASLGLAPALGADEPAAPEDDPLHRVETCALAGGCAALRTLDGLAEHPVPEVRRAVFEAVARLGLRQARFAERARRALEDPSPEVRLAALGALGAVGSGEDVPRLLARLEDRDGALRSAARGALERLSGAKAMASAQRWRAWWSRARDEGPRVVRAALDAMEEEPTCPTVERARREQVLRQGWIEPALVRERVVEWLGSSDERLRAEALRLVCGLKLADLEAAVRGALPFLGEEDRPLAEHVTAVLGLS